ncbi:MAG: hypothetical protein V3V10_04890, partial [Planctomycetota bacterium]
MSKEPYQKKKQEPNLNLVSAKRVYWSSGLLFGLLMLLVLSGLASITLLYDGIPSAENIRGTEGVVLDIVRTLRPAIRFIHEFGGFAAIFLSGWLAVELVRFGRNARAHGTAKNEKSTGLYITVTGVLSAIGLPLCLLFLIGTGIEARKFMNLESDTDFQLPAASKLDEFARTQESKVVEAHRGTLTFMLA